MTSEKYLWEHKSESSGQSFELSTINKWTILLFCPFLPEYEKFLRVAVIAVQSSWSNIPKFPINH